VCAFRNDGLGGVFTGMSFVYCDFMRSIRYCNHKILSAFSLITPGWLVVFWCVVFLGATCFVITLMKRQRLVILSPSLRFPFRAVPFLAGLLLIVALTGVTAFVSPSNNWDSMTYHMSRVVHWIQDRNVSFYPTHNPSPDYGRRQAKLA
jgi:hypothetical protein